MNFHPTVPFVRGILVKAAGVFVSVNCYCLCIVFVILSVKRVREGGSSKGSVYVISILYFSQSANSYYHLGRFERCGLVDGCGQKAGGDYCHGYRYERKQKN